MNTAQDWSQVEPLNDLTFGRAVVQAEDPVLVLFWACGRPLKRTLLPLAEEIVARSVEGVHEYCVNLDENPFLAEHFGHGGDPALILFHEGRVIGRWEEAGQLSDLSPVS